MFQIGDMVKHHKLRATFGIVVEVNINTYTIIVQWFNKGDGELLAYYPHFLVKVSQ